VWNGARFIHSESFTTGLCQLLTNGGTWTLPTIVTHILQQCVPSVGDEEADDEEPVGYVEENNSPRVMPFFSVCKAMPLL
jgi:hypothetical protein